jgi:hypothetical protein
MCYTYVISNSPESAMPLDCSQKSSCRRDLTGRLPKGWKHANFIQTSNMQQQQQGLKGLNLLT